MAFQRRGGRALLSSSLSPSKGTLHGLGCVWVVPCTRAGCVNQAPVTGPSDGSSGPKPRPPLGPFLLWMRRAVVEADTRRGPGHEQTGLRLVVVLGAFFWTW